jgi:hypothetical protein
MDDDKNKKIISIDPDPYPDPDPNMADLLFGDCNA